MHENLIFTEISLKQNSIATARITKECTLNGNYQFKNLMATVPFPNFGYLHTNISSLKYWNNDILCLTFVFVLFHVYKMYNRDISPILHWSFAVKNKHATSSTAGLPFLLRPLQTFM